MLYIEKKDIHQENFLYLLSKTKVNALLELKIHQDKTKSLSSTDFENLVLDQMQFSARETEFENKIRRTGVHGFPDIIAKGFFGAEIKMTTGDKWISTGNSIMESTRPEDVEKIYIFFGKFGGEIDIKYRAYEECLYDIGVTHSPRYKINMDLKDGEAIFDKMGIKYDELRQQSNPIKKIKDYYKSKLSDGEELWWIDSQTEESASPIITSFRKLNPEIQKKFLIEVMILFPEIFGKSSLKFERVAAYLVTNYNAVSSNLRDLFTAGGQVLMTIKDRRIMIPKIFYGLFEYANEILFRLENIEEEKLSYYWKSYKSKEPRMRQWINMLNLHSMWLEQGLFGSDIFEAGCHDKTIQKFRMKL